MHYIKEKQKISKAMVTEEQVYEALRECYDPEIPINIVDLGLVYEVKIIDDWVGVKMTLTAPGCPAHSFISQQVRERLLQIPGVKDADVVVVWEPRWNPSMMSEKARMQLFGDLGLSADTDEEGETK